MKRLLVLALLAASCGGRRGPEVRIAVGGMAQLVYLPTTLAQQLGYYEQEGLHVTLEDFPGGAKALEALLGGSADVVSGFYDHTIQMAAEGRPLRAFVTLLRYPGLILVSRGSRSVVELKGKLIGVTAPGSSTHLFLNYLLHKNGVAPDAVSVIGIGGAATAVAAMERGKVDAAVMTDPAFAQLSRRSSGLVVLADTRTGAGVEAVFGVSSYPASVFYAPAAWIAQNPDTARKLARAMHRTLEWIGTHSAEEILRRMPESQRGGDAAVYLAALRDSMPLFSPDGRMDPAGAEAVKQVLALSLPKVKAAAVDVSQTYTNDFVTRF